MKNQNPVFHKMVLLVALLTILMCPLLFIGVRFFPSSMGFLEFILCPSGMHLEQETEMAADPEGEDEEVQVTSLVCTDAHRKVDITTRMLIILFGVGILGVSLLVSWTLISPDKEPDVPDITME